MCAIAALALGLVAAACGGSERKLERAPAATSEQAEPPVSKSALEQPLSSQERAWLERLGEWVLITGQAQLDPTGAAARTCLETLGSQVGDAPSARMEELRRLAARACRHYQGRETKEAKRLEDAVLTAIYAYEYRGSENRALPVIRGKSEKSRVEPLLSRVVTSLVGKRTEVRCWSASDWKRLTENVWPYTEQGQEDPVIAGFALEDDHRMHLASDVCAPLVALAYEKHQPSGGSGKYELAVAVSVLAHEGRHRAGIELESVAECHGMQQIRRAARLLGADLGYAASLAELVWREHYPLMPDSYRSPECRDGGKLDLNPRSSVWP